MLERGTIYGVFILKSMQVKYHAKGRKLCVFGGPRKAFDRVTRIVFEWAIRKKKNKKVLVRSVMSLYEGAKTRVRVDSELSEKFEAKVGMHQGSVLSPSPSAVVIDVVAENARGCAK